MAQQNGFWEPRLYPSLLAERPFHAFDNRLRPILLKSEDVRWFLLMILASYCHIQSTEHHDRAMLKERLQRCDWEPEKDPAGKPLFFVPEDQLDSFQDTIEILSHHPNDLSGFSSTLMRNRLTGRATLAIRGIEYREFAKGGDKERDLGAMKQFRESGLSMAQILAAQRFLTSLIEQGVIDKKERIDLAGQDLGAHVAFVLNELFPGLVDRIVTVDALGYQRFFRR